MIPQQGATIWKVLEKRCGVWSIVELRSGSKCRVLNVVSGSDGGDKFARITTNISPEPSGEHSVDFFYSSEVLRIVDEETGMTIYEAGKPYFEM